MNKKFASLGTVLNRAQAKRIVGGGAAGGAKCPLECSDLSCSEENHCKCTNGGTKYSFCESKGPHLDEEQA
ncbi:MAG: hypothetical protein J0I09_10105 [Sphingobacteriia bacterium]|nr:hypothetical protein [Sphingobacteriia bacterium]